MIRFARAAACSALCVAASRAPSGVTRHPRAEKLCSSFRAVSHLATLPHGWNYSQSGQQCPPGACTPRPRCARSC